MGAGQAKMTFPHHQGEEKQVAQVISLLQVSGSAQPEAPSGAGKVGLLLLFRSKFEENSALGLLKQAFLSVVLERLTWHSWESLMIQQIPGPHPDRHLEWQSFEVDPRNPHFKDISGC